MPRQQKKRFHAGNGSPSGVAFWSVFSRKSPMERKAVFLRRLPDFFKRMLQIAGVAQESDHVFMPRRGRDIKPQGLSDKPSMPEQYVFLAECGVVELRAGRRNRARLIIRKSLENLGQIARWETIDAASCLYSLALSLCHKTIQWGVHVSDCIFHFAFLFCLSFVCAERNSRIIRSAI